VSDNNHMSLTLKIWRQPDAVSAGSMHTYQLSDVSPDMSFLEMLDVLNEELNAKGEDPIAFDSDCREGICGMCGLMINGDAHGPEVTTTCQLHMRSFSDGETITIEPWRATAFPVIKDLVVDRGAFDRIIQQGGYISVNTGSAPEAHSVPVPRDDAMRAFSVATCIGCGACVAACPTAPPRCSWVPRSPTSASCPRASPSVTPASSTWSPSTTTRASVAAPTSASARPRAPRRSRST
jgi:succinate dehydrogenase / fumarate reductase iron-sulfur subunit